MPKANEFVLQNHRTMEERFLRSHRREQILRSQGYRCAGCFSVLVPGQTDFDHRVPWSISKNSSDGNIHALCSGCHAFKTRRFDCHRIPLVRNIASQLAPSERLCYWCTRVVSKYFVSTHSCREEQEVWDEMQRQKADARHREQVFHSLKGFAFAE